MICFALKLAPWPLNKRKMRLHHWMKNNNITMTIEGGGMETTAENRSKTVCPHEPLF